MKITFILIATVMFSWQGIVAPKITVINAETKCSVKQAVKLQESYMGQTITFSSGGGYAVWELPPASTKRFTIRFKFRMWPIDPNIESKNPDMYSRFSIGIADPEAIQKLFINKESKETQENQNKKNTFKIQVKRNNSASTQNIVNGTWGACIGNTFLTRNVPKITLQYTDLDISRGWNYYELYDCKRVIDFSDGVAGSSFNGYHFLSQTSGSMIFPKSYSLVILAENEKAMTIEISPIQVFEEITDGETDVNPRYPEQSCQVYEKDAKKNPEAMFRLGLSYYHGTNGAIKNYFEAVEYFRKASSKQHVMAQYYLGLCYHFGRGVEKNDREAIKFFLQAGRDYYDPAQTMAYWYYLKGWWRPNFLQDKDKPENLIYNSGFQNNANGIYLGGLAQTGHVWNSNLFKLSPPRGGFLPFSAWRGNYKATYMMGEIDLNIKHSVKAMLFFKEAATLNFPPAMYRVAEFDNQKSKDSKEMLKAAAVAGYIPAMIKYALDIFPEQRQTALQFLLAADRKYMDLEDTCPLEIVLLKKIMTTDYSGILEKWSKGIDLEEKCIAGIFYEHGWGESKDLKKAMELYGYAADKKSLIGNYKKGMLLARGLVERPDTNQTVYYLRIAADEGFVQGQYALAEIFEKSDLRQSLGWYKKAANQEHGKAALRYGELMLKSNSTDKETLKYLAIATDNGEPRGKYLLGMAYYNGLCGLKKDKNKAAQLWNEYEVEENKKMNEELVAPLWIDMPYYTYDYELLRKYINNESDIPHAQIPGSAPVDIKNVIWHSALKRYYTGLKDTDKVLELYNYYFTKGEKSDFSAPKEIHIKATR